MEKGGQIRKFSLCNFLTKNHARDPACLSLSLLPRNRSGSHVGMILSFIIFITFIVFLYVVVQPAINTGQDKKTILGYIEMSIIENISANFISASIEINSSKNPSQNCVKLQNFLLLTEMTPPYIIVKNETGNIQEAYSDFSLAVPNLMINRKSSSNRFFKIYFSPEFDLLKNRTINPCPQIVERNYTIGVVKTGLYIFENELYGIIDYYKSDYERLRTELNVPPGNEFGLIFMQSNGTKIEVGDSPKSASVYAEEIPIQYIDRQANIQSGYISIKVW